MNEQTLVVRLVAALGSFRADMGAAAAQVRGFASDVGSSTGKIRQSYQDLGRASVIAGGALLTGFAMSAKAAMDFETQMRNVNTVSAGAFEQLGNQVIDLSRTLPQSATTLASGLYDIASSGFQGSDAMKILNASAVSASAGLTTTATSAKAITAVLNAYGRGASDATDVSDTLFQTVNLGVISFEQLAGTVGDWIGTAHAAGVSFEEASAAIAAMTLSGISAEESGTSLNRVLISFINPSIAMVDALHQIGYESGVSALHALGLQGALEALSKAGYSNVETMQALFPEVRGLRGALALAANDGKNFARVSEEITDAHKRQGAAQRALEEQSKSLSFQLGLMRNNIGAAAIEIGQSLLPVLRPVVGFITTIASGFASIPGPLRNVVVGLGLLAAVTATVAGGFLLLWPRLATTAAMLAGTTVAAEETTVALAGLAVGMRTALIASGVIGAGLTILSLIVSRFGQHHAEATPKIDKFVDAIKAEAQGVSGAVRDMTLERLAQLGVLEDLTKFQVIPEAVSFISSTDADQQSAALDGLREKLDALVGSGQLTYDQEMKLIIAVKNLNIEHDAAADKAGVMAAAVAQVGDAAETANQRLEDYKNTLDGIVADAFDVETAQDKVATDLAQMQARFDSANASRVASSEQQYQKMADAADRVRAAEERLQEAREKATGDKGHFASRDELRAVADAQRDVDKARRDQQKAAADGAKSVDEFSTSLDTQTEAGLRNRDFFRTWTDDVKNVAEKMMENKVPIGDIVDYLLDQRNALEESGDKWGFAKDKMGEYLTVLDKVLYSTALLKDAQMDAPLQVFVVGGGDSGKPAVRVMASGGLVSQGATPMLTGFGTDTVPAALTPGEFVVNRAAVARVGVGSLQRINRFADGGMVRPPHYPGMRGGMASINVEQHNVFQRNAWPTEAELELANRYLADKVATTTAGRGWGA